MRAFLPGQLRHSLACKHKVHRYTKPLCMRASAQAAHAGHLWPSPTIAPLLQSPWSAQPGAPATCVPVPGPAPPVCRCLAQRHLCAGARPSARQREPLQANARHRYLCAQVDACAGTVQQALIWTNDQIACFMSPTSPNARTGLSPFSAQALRPALLRLSSYLSQSPQGSPHYMRTMPPAAQPPGAEAPAGPAPGRRIQHSGVPQGQYPSRLLHEAAVTALTSKDQAHLRQAAVPFSRQGAARFRGAL